MFGFALPARRLQLHRNIKSVECSFRVYTSRLGTV